MVYSQNNKHSYYQFLLVLKGSTAAFFVEKNESNKLLFFFRFALCLCFFYLDVKRLAVKEDWVVDNEGITSLVRYI